MMTVNENRKQFEQWTHSVFRAKRNGRPVIQPDFHVSYPDIFNRCGWLDHRITEKKNHMQRFW